MKKYINFLLAVIVLLSACKDPRYDEMIGDSVYFPESDLQSATITVIDEGDYEHDFWIHKAGFFQDRFEGGLAIDYAYLVTYNEEHGTNFEMLNEKYFSFDREFIIESGVNELAVPLTLKANAVAGDLGYGTFYIPIRVYSRKAGGRVPVEKSNFILALTLKQPVLSIDGDKKGELIKDFGAEPLDNYEVDITARLDVKSPTDLQIKYDIDKSLLNQGEKLLEADFYSFKSEVTIPEGEQFAENFLSLNVAKMPRGRWVIPVRLTTDNDKVKLDEENYLKLTVLKGTLDDIQWASDYFQQNEFILPSQVITDELIATTGGADVQVSVDQAWVAVSTKADGNIYMNVTQINPVNHRERTATVTVLDNDTKLTKTIKVRQSAPGYGTILNRSLWSIPAFSSNVSDKVSQLGRLYSGIWPSSSANDIYLELNNRTEGSDPFILTFDMGEGHRPYNSLGLMPRLQWTQPAPKRIKVEVSDDMNNWTTLGPNAGTTGIWDAFTEAELKGSTDSYTNHWEGMIHWFDLGSQNKRYIRLSMYESWYSDGRVICLNQVFVSER